MNYTFERLDETHRQAVIDIFNYYVEESFAAFPEQPVPYPFYDIFLKMCAGYPAWAVRMTGGQIAGFGLLRAYNPLPAFAHTAEISYFLHPDFCGQGIGSTLLQRLLDDGRAQGIKTVLAAISALNEGSLRFHEHHGFSECGRFKKVCVKNGREMDVIWMQLELDAPAGEQVESYR